MDQKYERLIPSLDIIELFQKMSNGELVVL